jgi:hypothetical protein
MKRSLLVGLVIAAVAASCTSAPKGSGGSDTSFAAQMASTWHWAGDPQRVEVGILASDVNGVRTVSHGTIDLSFDYLGPDGKGAPEAGPSATAHYVPVPGTAASGAGPTVEAGARGVYEAEDVTFDRPGIWRATVHATIDGVARQLDTTFPVSRTSTIPAPGQPALKTDNLTIGSKGVRPAAIDSMAEGGNAIPDPELHRWTIAEAIRQHRPALVLFGTPAHCESQFCGPEVTELQRLASRFQDRAVFIHIEIWKDYNATPQVVNKAAADWLLRKLPDGSPEMTEPWLYLIGANGRIADRWGPLFDVDEVDAALEALPRLKGSSTP